MTHSDSPGSKSFSWTQFAFGLIFGGVAGAGLGWWHFGGGWELIATAAGGSLVCALACGWWGDRAWRWIGRWLAWLS